MDIKLIPPRVPDLIVRKGELVQLRAGMRYGLILVESGGTLIGSRDAPISCDELWVKPGAKVLSPDTPLTDTTITMLFPRDEDSK